MSDLKAAIIAAALNKVINDDPVLPRTSLYGLAAGATLTWRDMSSDERTKAVDKAKHQRARQAKFVKQQVDRSIERDQQHADIDDADVKFHEAVDAFDVGDKARFAECLDIVVVMDRIVTKIAYDKFMWSRRLARGAFGKDDVIQHTKLCLAMEMAKSDRDLAQMRTAAEVINHRGLIKYDDTFPHVQWLLGVATNRARSSIRHLCKANPMIDSIDQIDTMLANIGGVDSLISSCKADHAPGMTGYRVHSPGKNGLSLDPLVIAVALDGEFTRRNLDDLVDLILDDDKRRHDGTFMWSKHYVEVLAACGEPIRKFDSERLAAMYARRAVRKQFDWINEFLMQVLASYDGEGRKVWSNGVEVTHIDMLNTGTQREWVPVITQMVDPNVMAKTIVRVLSEVLAEALA